MRRDPLARMLGELNDGALPTQLASRARELAEKVAKDGGKGKITLTLEFERTGECRVDVKPSIKVSEPVGKSSSTTFWLDSNGELVRDDPQQMAVDFPELRIDGGEA